MRDFSFFWENKMKRCFLLKIFLGMQVLLMTNVPALAYELPQQEITGNVQDENGMPLPGVNVMVNGTNIGTTTDFDGNYTITVQEPGQTLIFSFIGFATQEIEVDNQTLINITLAEDQQALDEVVVVVDGMLQPEIFEKE